MGAFASNLPTFSQTSILRYYEQTRANFIQILSIKDTLHYLFIHSFIILPKHNIGSLKYNISDYQNLYIADRTAQKSIRHYASFE